MLALAALVLRLARLDLQPRLNARICKFRPQSPYLQLTKLSTLASLQSQFADLYLNAPAARFRRRALMFNATRRVASCSTGRLHRPRRQIRALLKQGPRGHGL